MGWPPLLADDGHVNWAGETKMTAGKGPLSGLKILDISTIIAGPTASTLLADFGAEVVKVELPGKGDALRALPPHKHDIPLWWKVANRNKKGITLDVRKDDGRRLFERLLPRFDILVENFRPGTLTQWGLDPKRLFSLNPKLTVLRVTGFGQTGPYRSRPGFARAFEAMAGLTHICGEPDRPPLHLGYPISDAIGGLFGAMSILAAAYERCRNPEAPGQEIDLSVAESMFRVLDFLAIEYDQLGQQRGRSGNTSQYAAPSNVYATKNGVWVSIPASTQTIFERLCQALGRPDLLQDPRFATNPERVRHCAILDCIISAEIAKRTQAELQSQFDSHQVAFSPVYTIADIFADPHFAARGAITQVEDAELGTVRMQNVVPRFSRTPGEVVCTGPGLGQHNQEIYHRWLGLSPAECAELRAKDVI
jgi:crotonobetainyl-CoA:carnitine CoA-transferase CaiB-like acyl-CoA transferase